MSQAGTGLCPPLCGLFFTCLLQANKIAPRPAESSQKEMPGHRNAENLLRATSLMYSIKSTRQSWARPTAVATESMSDAVKVKTKCASLACALRPMETRATCWRGCPLSRQRATPFRFATRLIAARKLSHKVHFRAAAMGQERSVRCGFRWCCYHSQSDHVEQVISILFVEPN